MTIHIIYSAADREEAPVKPDENQWFTLIKNEDQLATDADNNPWNNRPAIIKKRYELLDDCVASIRPARSLDSIDQKEHQKGLYFIEISSNTQNKSYSSRKLYQWKNAIEIIDKFEGLSFQTAERVWKVKKL
ncbi:hypothetical protein [Chromobacterium haemolyticum]|uniref:hypothetical protein n=1 Tax=Chromobacterium haemolyticum TaxID=394935 RepID=UPI0017470F4C|nr:hypothetical protein [Chromobacterium haemolyticum]QOD83440.1 hypothetical protein IEZ30_02800 [Chromobacterium haemolyticum]